ncbi:hypothetical protein HZS_5874 [Henneguya salminicola]|nr:hypothetical protein HZS_5874 [Henneguya salminicola]
MNWIRIFWGVVAFSTYLFIILHVYHFKTLDFLISKTLFDIFSIPDNSEIFLENEKIDLNLEMMPRIQDDYLWFQFFKMDTSKLSTNKSETYSVGSYFSINDKLSILIGNAFSDGEVIILKKKQSYYIS